MNGYLLGIIALVALFFMGQQGAMDTNTLIFAGAVVGIVTLMLSGDKKKG